ncbi:hypothetical protein Lesp02_11720 [Lentzea sp. NBRC 105346]|uniref:ATP-binding protein n=1 Tax=Lentzea sp. NBRC 105346 TaxID=3032205 RepID=UPI0024A3D95B|nr:LuxR C-terminal-related transcriptional regulator [Lentzea sp. NBRC 105346]GLZ28982.1 hypothetical protein Lesp02_11720 [Lentzea sp. NBRC 105346]
MSVCGACEIPIARSGRGRPASYCSNACRQRAHRKRTVAPKATPVRPDRFVGRAADLEFVARALRSARIVTVVGAGGIGKTRLAQELLHHRHPRGEVVRTVDLTSTTDGRDLTEVVADALEVHDGADEELLGTMIRAVGGRRTLLFADNCEHVAEQAALVFTTLLERCPELRILATSRETLRVPGEMVHWLAPLSPEETKELVLNRAGPDAPTEVCDRLDGVPLAVELAARRAEAMPLEEIAAAVHADLASTIEWSYRLLSAREQEVLRRMSVCEGGFGLDAARRVCGGDSVLPIVLGLNTKSLLYRAGSADSTRFRMLESIRRFAFAELAARPDELADAHAGLVRWLAEVSAPIMHPMRARSTSALDTGDAANLAVALRYLEGRPDPDDVRTLLACALARTWRYRGRVDSALRLLSTTLATTTTTEPDSPYRPIALIHRSWFAGLRGDHATAIGDATEAARSADVAVRVRGLNRLAGALVAAERTGTAVLVYRKALALATTPLATAISRQNLAWALVCAGEPQEARAHADRALLEYRTHAQPFECAGVLHTSAAVHLVLGDIDRAGRDLEEALRVAPSDSHQRAWVLEGLAMVAEQTGDPVRAATLLGAAAAHRAHRPVVDTPVWPQWVDDTRVRLSAALTDRSLTAATEHGRKLTPPEVLTLALSPATPDSPLTTREQQIAALLAEGLSNHGIGERLGIATSTVGNVLDRVKQKLGRYSRAELITWHIERGSRRTSARPGPGSPGAPWPGPRRGGW